MKYLTELEKQQLEFDWRYKGVSILNLLTEEEVDLYADELDNKKIRISSRKTRIKYLKNENNEWGEYDPYMYPHKESQLLTDLMI